MRIRSAEVSGFRAFSGNHRFNLDADVVLVIGVNGQGKTSLFDAIHWAITGEISRLNQPESVVSMYSPSGEARVHVTLASDDGRVLEVTRHSDGEAENLLVSIGDEKYRGEDAEYELLQCIWPDGLAAGESRKALRSALERGVYLQQDVLTSFLAADTDKERFSAISELIGAGRTTEFQSALERSRRAWTRITTQRDSEIRVKEDRLARLQSRLGELKDSSTAMIPSAAEWDLWWTHAEHLGASSAEVPKLGSSNAQSAIDVAMAELRSHRRVLERRRDQLRHLASRLQELPSPSADLAVLREELEETSQAVKAARETLATARVEVTEYRKSQLEERSEREDLIALAELALRQLGNRCPVCQQTYDVASTRERLVLLLEEASRPVELLVADVDLTRMSDEVLMLEERASAAREAFESALRAKQLRDETSEQIRSDLTELEIQLSHSDSISRAIDSALEDNSDNLKALSEVGLRGEALALSLARTGHLARQAELQKEVDQTRRDLFVMHAEFTAREETGALISRMIDGLRDASAEVVQGELTRLDPLLQRIYATADPHPEFRIVKLLSRMYRGSGRVLAEIRDPVHNYNSEAPMAYLSSSQMNVLAVSIFLALNLGIPTLPLRVAILDDPLQSLDDLNLLGLIDLLKRMRERRQLMVSTHDSRFASLLERKLRPVSDAQRTILVRLSGWSSEGPMVDQGEVEGDVVPIRIAAA